MSSAAAAVMDHLIGSPSKGSTIEQDIRARIVAENSRPRPLPQAIRVLFDSHR
jgi:hypothetical protein